MQRVIRLSSRHVPGARVRVVVYDSCREMGEAARRFNGCDVGEGCLGVTQGSTFVEGGTGREEFHPVVRLVVGHLGSEVTSHEMHHAVTGIWGAYVRSEGLDPELHHANETFAYLYGSLYAKLVGRLYALGYYGQDADA